MNQRVESLDYRMRHHLDIEAKWVEGRRVPNNSRTEIPFGDYGADGTISITHFASGPLSCIYDPSRFQVSLNFYNATEDEVIEWLQTAMAGGFACEFNEPGDDGYTTCRSLSEIVRLRGEVERRDNQIRNLKQLLESRDTEPR